MCFAIQCLQQAHGYVLNDNDIDTLHAKLYMLPFCSTSTVSTTVEPIPSILPRISSIRPDWDTYFMRLAFLASTRSNCMKRRVGAVIVKVPPLFCVRFSFFLDIYLLDWKKKKKNNRVISTGYNGTARGMDNCNQGGCPRCNSVSRMGTGLDLCLCLHAEENAIMEAGVDR